MGSPDPESIPFGAPLPDMMGIQLIVVDVGQNDFEPKIVVSAE